MPRTNHLGNANFTSPQDETLPYPLIVDAADPKTFLCRPCEHCRKLITVSEDTHENNYMTWCLRQKCQQALLAYISSQNR